MEGEMEAVLEKPVRTRWLFHARARDGSTIAPRSGMTIAVARAEDGTYVAGVSVCSMADNYSKRAGAGIAWTRVHSRLAGKKVLNTIHEPAGSPALAALKAMYHVLRIPSAHRDVDAYLELVVKPFERRIRNGSA